MIGLLAAGCAAAPAAGPSSVVVVDEVRTDVELPAAVERFVRRRADRRPELSGAALEVSIQVVRVERVAGSDPRLRAPRYRVVVELDGAVIQEGAEPLRARAEGEESFVARSGGIERWDGAYRTFAVRAAETAAIRLVDILAYRRARFTSETR